MSEARTIVSVIIPVFNDGERALDAVRVMLEQAIPDGFQLELIAVDDASSDGTPELMATCRDQRFSLLRLEYNQGRSAARNKGAQQSRGEVIIFMDCDCVPVDEHFVSAHLRAIDHGHVASTGEIIDTQGGFWARYQKAASQRRKRQHAQGTTYSGSSANLAIRRSAFDQTGGFNTQYRRYGFEDRDLLIRLADIGDIAWAEDAAIRHLGVPSLAEVSRKMMVAGAFSAEHFSRRHPAAYRALGYAAIDARLHPWLRFVALTLGRLPATIAPFLDRWLERIPFPVSRTLVKVISGLAFMYGTARAHALESSTLSDGTSKPAEM